MVEPSDVAKEVLTVMNSISPSFIAGGSLLRADSKDVDIIVQNSMPLKDRQEAAIFLMGIESALVELGAVQSLPESLPESSASSVDFPWIGLVKLQYKGIDFDILWDNSGSTPRECLSAFPLTIQQVGYGTVGWFYGVAFSEVLELSPGRRQVSSEALSKVMDKYMGYYPNSTIGPEFFNMLRSYVRRA